MTEPAPLDERPIADHALLSDSNGAALVAGDATIVWACLPRFDSAPIMSAILDRRTGYWALKPVGWQGPATSRRYLDGTMALESTFETPTGTVTVTDLMPFRSTPEVHDLGTDAPHAIIRRVGCTEGEVELEGLYRPRPEFGLMVPLLREVDGGVFSLGGSAALILSTTVDLDLDGDAGATARFTVREGETDWFALRRELRSYGRHPDMWDPETIAHWFEETLTEWSQWSEAHRRYEGPYRDLVRVSGRVLQSLTYWPTGAIVAAPSTSLPEQVGGERNWDYRYSWVRDAAMTMRALRVASCPHEAARHLDWVTRTAGGDIRHGQDLQIMYGIEGEHEVGERDLPHLGGWRGSAPVRVGNGAWHQRQLDVYGELLGAFYDLREFLDELDGIELRFLRDLADKATELWHEPDRGIWELRGEPRHFVHSKLMCWVALDRALRMADDLEAPDDQREDWKDGRDAIRRTILERGWNQQLGAFTQTLDGQDLDASVLLMAILGFLPADDERMRSTIEVIADRLTDERGLVYRYLVDDGLAGEEGTFLLCTFWLAQCLAMAGEVDRAREVFEAAAGHANDLGLMSEEVDPDSGELLGNFPQAFSHIGLVNAAQAITEAEGEAA